MFTDLAVVAVLLLVLSVYRAPLESFQCLDSPLWVDKAVVDPVGVKDSSGKFSRTWVEPLEVIARCYS